MAGADACCFCFYFCYCPLINGKKTLFSHSSFLLILLSLISIIDVECKVYGRCELAQELKYFHEIPDEQLATWVCIAQHESNFNTSAQNHGSGDHGLFQISQLYWCSPPGNGHACGLSCSELRDEDIEDDVICARRIYREHKRLSGDGFNAWTVYHLYCDDKKQVQRLIEGCFNNEEDDNEIKKIKENRISNLRKGNTNNNVVKKTEKTYTNRLSGLVKQFEFLENNIHTTTTQNPSSTIQIHVHHTDKIKYTGTLSLFENVQEEHEKKGNFNYNLHRHVDDGERQKYLQSADLFSFNLNTDGSGFNDRIKGALINNNNNNNINKFKETVKLFDFSNSNIDNVKNKFSNRVIANQNVLLKNENEKGEKDTLKVKIGDEEKSKFMNTLSLFEDVNVVEKKTSRTPQQQRTTQKTLLISSSTTLTTTQRPPSTPSIFSGSGNSNNKNINNKFISSAHKKAVVVFNDDNNNNNAATKDDNSNKPQIGSGINFLPPILQFNNNNNNDFHGKINNVAMTTTTTTTLSSKPFFTSSTLSTTAAPPSLHFTKKFSPKHSHSYSFSLPSSSNKINKPQIGGVNLPSILQFNNNNNNGFHGKVNNVAMTTTTTTLKPFFTSSNFFTTAKPPSSSSSHFTNSYAFSLPSSNKTNKTQQSSDTINKQQLHNKISSYYNDDSNFSHSSSSSSINNGNNLRRNVELNSSLKSFFTTTTAKIASFVPAFTSTVRPFSRYDFNNKKALISSSKKPFNVNDFFTTARTTTTSRPSSSTFKFLLSTTTNRPYFSLASSTPVRPFANFSHTYTSSTTAATATASKKSFTGLLNDNRFPFLEKSVASVSVPNSLSSYSSKFLLFNNSSNGFKVKASERTTSLPPFSFAYAYTSKKQPYFNGNGLSTTTTTTQRPLVTRRAFSSFSFLNKDFNGNVNDGRYNNKFAASAADDANRSSSIFRHGFFVQQAKTTTTTKPKTLPPILFNRRQYETKTTTTSKATTARTTTASYNYYKKENNDERKKEESGGNEDASSSSSSTLFPLNKSYNITQGTKTYSMVRKRNGFSFSLLPPQ